MDGKYLLEVVSRLTLDETKILLEMRPMVGVPAKLIADHTEYSTDEVRQVFKLFRRLGIAEFGFMMSEDQGELMGSGYWLENFGEAVQYLAGVGAGLIKRRDHAILTDRLSYAMDELRSHHATVPISRARALYLRRYRGQWVHATVFTIVERLRDWEIDSYEIVGVASDALVEMAKSRVRK